MVDQGPKCRRGNQLEPTHHTASPTHPDSHQQRRYDTLGWAPQALLGQCRTGCIHLPRLRAQIRLHSPRSPGHHTQRGSPLQPSRRRHM